MMLDNAYQVVAGVVALVNCLCHWQDRSRVIFDRLVWTVLSDFTFIFAYSESHYAIDSCKWLTMLLFWDQ